MPNFSRRGFLQLMGAAGIAPLMPSLPGRATVAAGGASTSKALWAGIYANSGSVSKFAGAARGMGLSNAAIQGIGARSVGVRIVLAAASNPITRIAVADKGVLAQPTSSQPKRLKTTRKVMGDIKRFLSDDVDEATVPKELDIQVFGSPRTPGQPDKSGLS